MELKDIVSMIGLLALMQIIIGFAYFFAFSMDNKLYEANKYNENRNTQTIGMQWLFRRVKKNNEKEIFTIALVHEAISICLSIIAITMFILTLILNNQMIMFVGVVPILIYLVYCSAMERHIARKNR